jgi:hypothetical protein
MPSISPIDFKGAIVPLDPNTDNLPGAIFHGRQPGQALPGAMISWS